MPLNFNKHHGFGLCQKELRSLYTGWNYV